MSRRIPISQTRAVLDANQRIGVVENRLGPVEARMAQFDPVVYDARVFAQVRDARGPSLWDDLDAPGGDTAFRILTPAGLTRFQDRIQTSGSRTGYSPPAVFALPATESIAAAEAARLSKTVAYDMDWGGAEVLMTSRFAGLIEVTAPGRIKGLRMRNLVQRTYASGLGVGKYLEQSGVARQSAISIYNADDVLIEDVEVENFWCGTNFRGEVVPGNSAPGTRSLRNRGFRIVTRNCDMGILAQQQEDFTLSDCALRATSFIHHSPPHGLYITAGGVDQADQDAYSSKNVTLQNIDADVNIYDSNVKARSVDGLTVRGVYGHDSQCLLSTDRLRNYKIEDLHLDNQTVTPTPANPNGQPADLNGHASVHALRLNRSNGGHVANVKVRTADNIHLGAIQLSGCAVVTVDGVDVTQRRDADLDAFSRGTRLFLCDDIVEVDPADPGDETPTTVNVGCSDVTFRNCRVYNSGTFSGFAPFGSVNSARGQIVMPDLLGTNRVVVYGGANGSSGWRATISPDMIRTVSGTTATYGMSGGNGITLGAGSTDCLMSFTKPPSYTSAALTTLIPLITEGSIVHDLTLNKLRFKRNAVYETVTSA